MTATPAESREELEKLERKHAEHPEGRYFVPLANAYRKAGELDRAMLLLREGLERHPDYLSAHIVLGRCLADRGDSAGADTEFRYVLSLDPQNLIALRTLGELAIASGKLDAARAWYGDLLAVDPMNEDARRALDTIARAPAAEDVAEQEPVGETPASSSTTGKPEPALQRGTDTDDFGGIFGTMVNLDENAEGEAPFQDEGDAVVTETIAELYTRQGFYARAADVYRELIRRRGGDSGLEERLRRVEQLAASGSELSGAVADSVEQQPPASPSAEPVSDAAASDADQDAHSSWAVQSAWDSSTELQRPDAESPREEGSSWEYRDASLTGSSDQSPVGDPFADSFQHGFPALDEPGRAPEPSSGAATRQENLSDSGDRTGSESIRDFLRGVVAWSPSSAVLEAPGVTPSEPGDLPASTSILDQTTSSVDTSFLDDITFLDQPAAGDSGFLDEASHLEQTTGGETGFLDDTSYLGGDVFPDRSTPMDDFGGGPESTEPEQLGEMEFTPMTPSSADRFPWEIPDPDQDPLAADVPGIEPLDLDEVYTFEEAAGEPTSSADAEPEPEAIFPEGDLPGSSTPTDAPAAPPAAAATPETPEPRPATPDPQDDDDLESFQAWLRSLKH